MYRSFPPCQAGTEHSIRKTGLTHLVRLCVCSAIQRALNPVWAKMVMAPVSTQAWPPQPAVGAQIKGVAMVR
jgi:hypothetical protein